MPPEVAKYLHDMAVACQLIEDFTRGKSFADYQADALLRAGVEREFITIGEAMTQADKLDPTAIASISALRQIISFRNVLVHGYASIQDATVWGVIENDLATLSREVKSLLATASNP